MSDLRILIKKLQHEKNPGTQSIPKGGSNRYATGTAAVIADLKWSRMYG